MLTLQELEDAVATMLRQLDDGTNQTLRVKRRLWASLVRALKDRNEWLRAELTSTQAKLLQTTLEERERCALVAALHSQYPVTTDYDRGYDKARADAAAEIRMGQQ